MKKTIYIIFGIILLILISIPAISYLNKLLKDKGNNNQNKTSYIKIIKLNNLV